MIFEQEVKEYDLINDINYIGLIRYQPKETTIRIDRMNFVFDSNLVTIGRRARYGRIETHDPLRAVVVFVEDIGESSFTFRRRI